MRKEINLSIPAFPHLRESAQTISLAGINVVLGLNGSGKSKLLKEIEHQANQNQIPVLRIQGNRFQLAPYATAVSLSHVESYKGKLIEQFEKEYRQKDNGSRIEKAFRLLAARDFVAHQNYANSVLRWYEGERNQSEEPKKPEPEIQKLFNLVSSLLPHIEFVNHKDGYIQARYKKQGPYHVHEISDGEREIICNFIDIFVCALTNGLLLVDEPELHLHPSLACNFWNLIEKRFPDANFLYATHFMGFALRPAVNRLFHIGNKGQLVALPSNGALPIQERADFLGAIPGILHSSRLLFCEGRRQIEQEDPEVGNSFDFEFYSWLLRDDNTKIQPMGPSSAVVEAARATGVFHELSNDVIVAGIVDRDDYPDERIKSYEAVVEVLPYYEAESYLCHVELLTQIAKHKNVEIDRDCLKQRLIAHAREQIPRVISRRFTHRGKKETDQQSRIMDEERERVTKAVNAEDMEEILRLFHGKELANIIAPSVGCRDSRELLSSAISAVNPTEIEALRSLHGRLLKRLGLT